LVGLGTGLGLIPALVLSVGKVSTDPPVAMTSGDIANIASFFFCAAVALVCLFVGGIDWWRNRGLATDIRARTKRGVIFGRPRASSSAESVAPSA
jgi:hypothetical protein